MSMYSAIATDATTTRVPVPVTEDSQRELLLNPSARVKNTNCPFQVVIKIDQNGCCVIDIEFEHNHSLETLEAVNFRDISSDCADKTYKKIYSLIN